MSICGWVEAKKSEMKQEKIKKKKTSRRKRENGNAQIKVKRKISGKMCNLQFIAVKDWLVIMFVKYCYNSCISIIIHLLDIHKFHATQITCLNSVFMKGIKIEGKEMKSKTCLKSAKQFCWYYNSHQIRELAELHNQHRSSLKSFMKIYTPLNSCFDVKH